MLRTQPRTDKPAGYRKLGTLWYHKPECWRIKHAGSIATPTHSKVLHGCGPIAFAIGHHRSTAVCVRVAPETGRENHTEGHTSMGQQGLDAPLMSWPMAFDPQQSGSCACPLGS